MEKEHNDYLVQEAIQQRQKNIQYKIELNNKLNQEYQREEEEKKLRKLKEDEENRKKQNTGLDLKYEKHMGDFRRKVNDLSDKVHNNAQNFIKYKTENYNNDKRIENYQDKCYNAYGKNNIILQNKINDDNGDYQYDVPMNYNAINTNNNQDNYWGSNQISQGYNPSNQYSNDINNKYDQYNQVQESTEILDVDKYRINSDLICNDKNHINSINSSQPNNRNLPNISNLGFNSSIRNINNNSHNIYQSFSHNNNYNNNYNQDDLEKIRQNSPSYKNSQNYYPYNSRNDYNKQETHSSLNKNILAHNNSHHLEDMYKKARNEYTAISKSVLDFNKEQINYKNHSRLLEEQDKKKMIDERMREAQKMKLQNMESNIMKHQKQNNYKNILDSQTNPSLKNNSTQDSFKFYVGPKNYYLGSTQLDYNPILNPVNNYGFARYYLQKNTNALNQSNLNNDINLNNSYKQVDQAYQVNSS